MRRSLPLLLVGAFGFAMLIQYFTPLPLARAMYGRVLEWMQVIFAAGLVLGGMNYARTHLRKVGRPGGDRVYSALALTALGVMLGAGFFGGTERGSLFLWLFNNVQVPLQQTVFSLLAFFVASAAFRGFRARSIEAALLLGVALLVMIGRIPVGEMMGIGLPEAARWLVDVPAVAAKRGILIGIGLGSVAVALRVMLGIERAWLGGGNR
jgi:hypothetical protein